jgi:hypothetical protein
MAHLFLLAQNIGPVDPGAVGVSVTSLIGSLGAAGAAVAVTYYFLNFLKDHGEKQDRLFGEFKNFHAESQKKFQDQLDRLTDRQEMLQRAYQDQVARITDGQNALLRDAIMAMKAVEKTLDNSSSAIRGIEQSVGTLQSTMFAIESMVRRPGDSRGVARAGRAASNEET